MIDRAAAIRADKEANGQIEKCCLFYRANDITKGFQIEVEGTVAEELLVDWKVYGVLYAFKPVAELEQLIAVNRTIAANPPSEDEGVKAVTELAKCVGALQSLRKIPNDDFNGMVTARSFGGAK